MAGGRKRTVSLEKVDMIALGEAMIKWVEENEPLHLSFWYKGVKMLSYNTWQAYIKCEEFVPYYDKAISLISKNYVDGTIPPPLASRFLRRYFNDMRDQEDNDMNLKLEKELEKKKKELDYQYDREEKLTKNKSISPNDQSNDYLHQMMLKDAKIQELESQLANKSKTE